MMATKCHLGSLPMIQILITVPLTHFILVMGSELTADIAEIAAVCKRTIFQRCVIKANKITPEASRVHHFAVIGQGHTLKGVVVYSVGNRALHDFVIYLRSLKNPILLGQNCKPFHSLFCANALLRKSNVALLLRL